MACPQQALAVICGCLLPGSPEPILWSGLFRLEHDNLIRSDAAWTALVSADLINEML